MIKEKGRNGEEERERERENGIDSFLPSSH